MNVQNLDDTKGSPVHETPTNAGSWGRIYCAQPYPALQEADKEINHTTHLECKIRYNRIRS